MSPKPLRSTSVTFAGRHVDDAQTLAPVAPGDLLAVGADQTGANFHGAPSVVRRRGAPGAVLRGGSRSRIRPSRRKGRRSTSRRATRPGPSPGRRGRRRQVPGGAVLRRDGEEVAAGVENDARAGSARGPSPATFGDDVPEGGHPRGEVGAECDRNPRRPSPSPGRVVKRNPPFMKTIVPVAEARPEDVEFA